MASEDHCPACTQWGPESARRAVVWRKTVLVQHRRCTKPAGDATATTWPSRVLLLVERRGADTRNRRWRAVGEQQHCCAAAVRARPRRAGRPSSACLSSPRATGLAPEPHLGCIRKLSLSTSQPRPSGWSTATPLSAVVPRDALHALRRPYLRKIFGLHAN